MDQEVKSSLLALFWSSKHLLFKSWEPFSSLYCNPAGSKKSLLSHSYLQHVMKVMSLPLSLNFMTLNILTK